MDRIGKADKLVFIRLWQKFHIAKLCPLCDNCFHRVLILSVLSIIFNNHNMLLFFK